MNPDPSCQPLVAPSDDEGPVPLSAFTRVAPNSRRRTRDSAWGVALLASVAFVVTSGVFSVRNSNAHDLLRVLGDPEWAADPRNCPSSSPSSSSSSVLFSSSPPSSSSSSATNEDRAARLLRSATVLLPLTLAASLAAGAAALAAFRRAPLAMAKAAVGAQIALPLFAALLAAVNGFPGPALAFSLVGALTAAVFYMWRDRVELCARLLALASSALAGTPALVAVSLASDAASLVAAGGLGLFAAAAAANGRVVQSTTAAAAAGGGGGGQGGGPVCVWQPAAFAPPLAVVSSVVALWASLTLAQLKTFVVAGSVSSWYFSSSSGETNNNGASSSPLRSSLRAALGPQFGSLSLAGLVLTATQLLRSAIDALQNAGASSNDGEDSLAAGCFRFLGAILATLARGALAFLDYLTKFAVVAAAVSGRGLLASGKAATSVLRSAMLDAFGVWYFPPLLLSSWTAAAGAVWGVGTGVAYNKLGGRGAGGGSHSRHGGASSPSLPWQESAAVGAACGLLAWAALSAVASVLLSAVDALFFCYAADRARAAEEAAGGGESGLGGGSGGALFRTRAEVHEVLDRVPCGVVVQQPDGGVSYGAPVGSSSGIKKHVPPGEMLFSRG